MRPPPAIRPLSGMLPDVWQENGLNHLFLFIGLYLWKRPILLLWKNSICICRNVCYTLYMRRAKVQHRADELGIVLIDNGDNFVLVCPDGYRLKDTQTHTWQEVFSYGLTMPYIWKSLFEEMQNGIEICLGCPECQE